MRGDLVAQDRLQMVVNGLVDRGVIRRGDSRKKIAGKKSRLYAVIDSELFATEQQ
jgi:hypothetical protein